MSLTINFLSSSSLPSNVLYSFYIGDDEVGYHSQIRKYTTGAMEIRDADSGWRVL